MAHLFQDAGGCGESVLTDAQAADLLSRGMIHRCEYCEGEELAINERAVHVYHASTDEAEDELMELPAQENNPR